MPLIADSPRQQRVLLPRVLLPCLAPPKLDPPEAAPVAPRRFSSRRVDYVVEVYEVARLKKFEVEWGRCPADDPKGHTHYVEVYGASAAQFSDLLKAASKQMTP